MDARLGAGPSTVVLKVDSAGMENSTAPLLLVVVLKDWNDQLFWALMEPKGPTNWMPPKVVIEEILRPQACVP